jgi:lipopolysaccharide transport system permease protein
MHIFVLPIFLLMLFIVSIGCGVWVAALTVKYRDFRYVIPFVVQIGLYVTPVGFSSGIVPKAFRLLYYCNPMAGVIDGVRWSVLRGQTSVYWEGVLMSFLVAFVLLWVGVNYFRRTEQAFADII